MNILTNMALGAMAPLKPYPAQGNALAVLVLPPPRLSGGLPLMQALAGRQSQREFSLQALHAQMLSDLPWSACGINRKQLGGSTAPSAMNAQEVDLYVALPEGLYLYEPEPHQLRLTLHSDVRSATGYQDFVDRAALDLVFVADHRRMMLVPASQRSAYAAAGAMAQNVYLFCASECLSTVIRAWIDREALGKAMGLDPDEQVLLAQTAGYAAPA